MQHQREKEMGTEKEARIGQKVNLSKAKKT